MADSQVYLQIRRVLVKWYGQNVPPSGALVAELEQVVEQEVERRTPDPQVEGETADHAHVWERVDPHTNIRKCARPGCTEVGWYIPEETVSVD